MQRELVDLLRAVRSDRVHLGETRACKKPTELISVEHADERGQDLVRGEAVVEGAQDAPRVCANESVELVSFRRVDLELHFPEVHFIGIVAVEAAAEGEKSRSALALHKSLAAILRLD